MSLQMAISELTVYKDMDGQIYPEGTTMNVSCDGIQGLGEYTMSVEKGGSDCRQYPAGTIFENGVPNGIAVQQVVKLKTEQGLLYVDATEYGLWKLACNDCCAP